MKTYNADSDSVAMALLKAVSRARHTAMLGVLTIGMTACSSQMRLPSSEGRILIDADAKGMQAFMDGANGLITNGKASADQNTAHWQTRNAQEQEVTKREYAPSFWDKLAGNSTGSQGTK